MANEVIKCKFNLFDEGRKYTGHHRKYILESALNVCYAPETREGIQLREKFGYLGHGRRMLADKLRLSETEVVRLPSGQSILVENIPSNVTTFFEVGKNGDVEHHQEILLESEPGKTVFGLHKSRVGGFSWACSGADGGAMGATKINSFEGFDYVLNPGFSANRGYILESADASTRDMIIENIAKMGVKDPEKRLESWVSSVQFYAAELEERLKQSAIYEAAIQEEMDAHRENSERLSGELAMIQTEKENAIRTRQKIILEGAAKSVIAIPDRVQQALISMADEKDFYEIVSFFESAGRIDLGRYPVSGSAKQGPTVPARNTPPEYGSHEAGVDFSENIEF